MQKANKLYVIGIGYRPLEQRAQEAVLSADVILASNRLFEVFQKYAEFNRVQARVKVINNVNETISYIRSQFSMSPSEGRTITLLGSGDPMFFGIGRRIREEFGKEMVEILPDLSSVQEAFARINEPWDDAFFMSLHGGPDVAKRRKLPYEATDIPQLLERYGKIAVLTDKENNPVLIAKILQSARGKTPLESPLSKGGMSGINSEVTISVCERLGYADEKVTQGIPEHIAAMTFSDPNVVIIQESGDTLHSHRHSLTLGAGRSLESGVRFGLREEEIEHERGLITKDEIRAVTLHKLRLPERGVFWDIGAGSGSISIEAARLCPRLQIFAIEKEQERSETVKKNIVAYDTSNVKVVHGAAPDTLADLPLPHRVFIGGSGGNLGDIIKLVSEKMSQGIIVINAVTLETLHDAQSSLKENGFSCEISEISVSRSKTIAGKQQMTALNPVFILKGERG